MALPEPPEPARAGPQVLCPGCGQGCTFAPGNPWRPFCSEHCRSVDLGAWASERYRVPDRPADDEDPSALEG